MFGCRYAGLVFVVLLSVLLWRGSLGKRRTTAEAEEKLKTIREELEEKSQQARAARRDFGRNNNRASDKAIQQSIAYKSAQVLKSAQAEVGEQSAQLGPQLDADVKDFVPCETGENIDCGYEPLFPDVPARLTTKLNIQLFRRIDARCTNFLQPLCGASLRPHERLAPPAYEDGRDAPRTLAADGTTPLPSCRDVSLGVSNPNSGDGATDPSSNFTVLLMQWGQFLDHDITLTPEDEVTPVKYKFRPVLELARPTVLNRPNVNAFTDCCSPRVLEHNQDVCFNIPLRLDETEPFYSTVVDFFRNYHVSQANQDRLIRNFATDCHPFVRSLPTFNRNCSNLVREQLNEITSYIDGSNVYGSDYETSIQLRTLQHGLMREESRENLPRNFRNLDCQSSSGSATPCAFAGDIRVSEHVGLASMHTVWLRQHNQIAEYLFQQFEESFVQLSFTVEEVDQFIYYKTRQIVGAMMQYITYHEFLPVILGDQVMDDLGLRDGSGFVYNDGVCAQTTNEFSTAAYRFGHSLIPQFLERIVTSDQGITVADRADLSRLFFNADEYYGTSIFHGVQSHIQGMAVNPSHKLNRILVSAVQHELFLPARSRHHFGLPRTGQDLGARNCQRGRDHGLPDYLAYVAECSASWPVLYVQPFVLPTDFLGLATSGLMTLEAAEAFADVYRDVGVGEIDLFHALISETPLDGALVGPTLICLLSDQFFKLKFGDRLWYENPDIFTDFQIAAIRNVTLARVLCDTTYIESIQHLAFHMPDGWNQVVDCSEIQEYSLEAFIHLPPI